MAKYFRFLENGVGTGSGGNHQRVTIPALNHTYDIPQDALGSWEGETRKLFENMMAPALGQPWLKAKPALSRVQGLAEDGSTLPASAVTTLKQGAPPVATHFFAVETKEGDKEAATSPVFPTSRSRLDQLVEQ